MGIFDKLALLFKVCYGFVMSDSRTTLVEKAKIIIEQSHLAKNEKEMLEGRVPFIAETMLQMFVTVCEEDPFSTDAIVKNLKMKLDAQGNLKRIHEIVKQERREMEDALAMG
jgi:hypothetical protein